MAPKSAISALSEIRLILSGLQASVERADAPLGLQFCSARAQIHTRSPASQRVGFTRTPQVQTSSRAFPPVTTSQNLWPHPHNGRLHTRDNYTPVHTAPLRLLSTPCPERPAWVRQKLGGEWPGHRTWDLGPSAWKGLVLVNTSCPGPVLTPDLWFGAGRKCIRSF